MIKPEDATLHNSVRGYTRVCLVQVSQGYKVVQPCQGTCLKRVRSPWHQSKWPESILLNLSIGNTPVTIIAADHEANAFRAGARFPEDAYSILQQANCQAAKNLILLQSSLSSSDIAKSSIVPRDNGFVHACIDAYSDHRHLSIRPDDVWFTMLTQLSSYINANAEQLRGKFVAHEGKKELKITSDFGDR